VLTLPLLGQQVLRERRDLREKLAHKVKLVRLVLLGTLVLLALKETKVSKETSVQQAHLATWVPQVLQVRLVLLVLDLESFI
jgi:hypothetical protein